MWQAIGCAKCIGSFTRALDAVTWLQGPAAPLLCNDVTEQIRLITHHTSLHFPPVKPHPVRASRINKIRRPGGGGIGSNRYPIPEVGRSQQDVLGSHRALEPGLESIGRPACRNEVQR